MSDDLGCLPARWLVQKHNWKWAVLLLVGIHEDPYPGYPTCPSWVDVGGRPVPRGTGASPALRSRTAAGKVGLGFHKEGVTARVMLQMRVSRPRTRGPWTGSALPWRVHCSQAVPSGLGTPTVRSSAGKPFAHLISVRLCACRAQEKYGVRSGSSLRPASLPADTAQALPADLDAERVKLEWLQRA